ncbi:MAG: alpha/beta hydrolase [Nanoarchaeota archaeon]
MKRVFIVHGWDGNPKEPMLYWLKNELEKRDFEVVNLKMPNPAEPKIKTWVDHLKKSVKNPDKNTYFVGHSIGCQAILRYVESLNKKIGGCVLIAPWMHLDEETKKEEGPEVEAIAKPWMETPINFNKVASKISKKTVCIFSDNDPYVPLSNTKLFKKNLNAKIIIEHKKYHFDPYNKIKRLSSALKSLLEISK